MSNEIFNLDKYEKRILRNLALKGPMNLIQLSDTPTKKIVGLERWGMNNYLYGSARHMGLIPFGYVAVTPRNKKENEYSLTINGILASMATTPLASNISFQNYVKFVENYFPTKGSNVFVKKCIEGYIKLFLSWHYLNGFNLTKQKTTEEYYMKFFEDIKIKSSIKINQIQEEDVQEFFNLMNNCITYFTVLDLLTYGKYFKKKTLFSVVDWKKTKSRNKEKNNKYLFAVYLWQWPYLITKSNITLESKDTPIYDFYSYTIPQKVQENLDQIEAKLRWKSEL